MDEEGKERNLKERVEEERGDGGSREKCWNRHQDRRHHHRQSCHHLFRLPSAFLTFFIFSLTSWSKCNPLYPVDCYRGPILNSQHGGLQPCPLLQAYFNSTFFYSIAILTSYCFQNFGILGPSYYLF